MKGVGMAALTGFVMGLCTQIAALYGFQYAFQSLLAQIPLAIGSFVASLFLRLLASSGFSLNINLIPFIFSISIPVFYAMIAGLTAFVLRRWKE